MKTNPLDSKSANPSRRWFRFRLRSLLLLVTLVAVWLAFHANRAARQRTAVNTVARLGGDLTYYYEYDERQRAYPFDGAKIPDATPPGPRWLRALIGHEHFIRVLEVHLVYTKPSNDDLAQVAGLHDLVKLHLGRSPIGNDGLSHMSALQNLRWLDLEETDIDDVGLEHLASLQNLERLILSGNHIEGDGLRHLKGLKKLKYLRLRRNPLTDAALPHLAAMTSLERLYLEDTYLTDEGLQRLRRALPNCLIRR